MAVVVGNRVVGRALVSGGTAYIRVGETLTALRQLSEGQGVTMHYQPDGEYSHIVLSGSAVNDFLNGYFKPSPGSDKPAD